MRRQQIDVVSLKKSWLRRRLLCISKIAEAHVHQPVALLGAEIVLNGAMGAEDLNAARELPSGVCSRAKLAWTRRRHSVVFRIAAANAASMARAISFCPDWLGWMSQVN